MATGIRLFLTSITIHSVPTSPLPLKAVAENLTVSTSVSLKQFYPDRGCSHNQWFFHYLQLRLFRLYPSHRNKYLNGKYIKILQIASS